MSVWMGISMSGCLLWVEISHLEGHARTTSLWMMSPDLGHEMSYQWFWQGGALYPPVASLLVHQPWAMVAGSLSRVCCFNPNGCLFLPNSKQIALAWWKSSMMSSKSKLHPVVGNYFPMLTWWFGSKFWCQTWFQCAKHKLNRTQGETMPMYVFLSWHVGPDNANKAKHGSYAPGRFLCFIIDEEESEEVPLAKPSRCMDWWSCQFKTTFVPNAL